MLAVRRKREIIEASVQAEAYFDISRPICDYISWRRYHFHRRLALDAYF